MKKKPRTASMLPITMPCHAVNRATIRFEEDPQDRQRNADFQKITKELIWLISWLFNIAVGESRVVEPRDF